MKITASAAVALVALAMMVSVQAKGSKSSGSSGYSSSPREHNVSGYTRKDGTYVQPHNRSNPDGARNNNWTTQGNTNPHTGKDGTIPRSNYERSR